MLRIFLPIWPVVKHPVKHGMNEDGAGGRRQAGARARRHGHREFDSFRLRLCLDGREHGN